MNTSALFGTKRCVFKVNELLPLRHFGLDTPGQCVRRQCKELMIVCIVAPEEAPVSVDPTVLGVELSETHACFVAKIKRF